MEQTANLELPYIMPSQAQKHVTHNEAIRRLDALVQLAVLDRDLSDPPASPSDGERYLVAPGGTDAWAGRDGQIAAWQDGAWAFLAPKAGWLAWVADEERLIGFGGAGWTDAAVHSVNPAPLVGVNATADATNRLAIKSPASLFDQEAGDHRVKINKAAAGDTASLVFQSGYSGRAEFGLAGDDDWHVKVSADGSAWTEALHVSRTTGRVRLPAALPLSDNDQIVARRHIREKLTANRTYYVRPDGNDSNNGLANTSGGAFLTIQRAYDVICTIDLAGFTATIQIGDGTYTTGLNFDKPWVGGNLVFQGNAGTPGNVLISVASANAIASNAPLSGVVTIKDLKVQTAGAGTGILHNRAGLIQIANLDFGACVAAHIQCFGPGADILVIGDYGVSGGSIRHMEAGEGGRIVSASRTVTLTGTPAFSFAFASAQRLGIIMGHSMAFSGPATGPRYNAALNSMIFTGGGGGSYFPGNSAGTTATGGQYA